MKRMFCWLIACMMMLSPLAVGEVDSDNYNWYEVFVYSYQDSNGDGIGDLPGLMSRLDYIHDMGYDGLWLMPIMPSPSYHKYDVMDYMAVDPQYGTLEDFKALVAACHERGIRIIIDLPVNHTSTQHPWFLAACDAVCAGDMEDPFVSYYNFSQGGAAKTIPVSGTEWYYEEQFAGGNMPDLNLDNPAVLEEIRSIIGFWLTECDVDGFRLDAVTSYFTANTEKNIVLLNEIKAMAEATKPGSYLVGEVWTGLDTIAEYYKSDLDSFFLFPMSQAEGYIVRSLRSRNSPAETFVKYLRQVEEAFPRGSWRRSCPTMIPDARFPRCRHARRRTRPSLPKAC